MHTYLYTYIYIYIYKNVYVGKSKYVSLYKQIIYILLYFYYGQLCFIQKTKEWNFCLYTHMNPRRILFRPIYSKSRSTNINVIYITEILFILNFRWGLEQQ